MNLGNVSLTERLVILFKSKEYLRYYYDSSYEKCGENLGGGVKIIVFPKYGAQKIFLKFHTPKMNLILLHFIAATENVTQQVS